LRTLLLFYNLSSFFAFNRQLAKDVCDDMVKRITAARADHGIY
jgi:hypothetical protein